MIKFFDVLSFDMSNMIALLYIPTAAAWLCGSSSSISSRVAVADKNSALIRVYHAEGSQEPIFDIDIHSYPVK